MSSHSSVKEKQTLFCHYICTINNYSNLTLAMLGEEGGLLLATRILQMVRATQQHAIVFCTVSTPGVSTVVLIPTAVSDVLKKFGR